MNSAHVQSVDELRSFRAALWKFVEMAQCVLSDAEGELQRTLNWLETEADGYWQGQIRKRQESVARAKEAVRAKKMFRHADGSRPSAIEEEKALRLAIQRLEEAEMKLKNVHRYGTLLSKEVMQYKGQVQRFANSVAIDIPMAVSTLDSLLRSLQDYLSIQTAEGELTGATAGAETGGTGGDLPSMARKATQERDEREPERAEDPARPAKEEPGHGAV